MTDPGLRTNPFALPGAEPPRTGWYDVNGCQLYAEVRGHGPGLLLIGASSDDAEMFRPIAELLTDATVVTYDRRGTLRSSRDDWPCGAAQHADDAAGLLSVLGLTGADVFGASAGGIVAVRLALRYPTLVRRVLAFEPGYFALTEWYAARADALAENFVRDDIPATGETVDLDALAASGVDLRFSYGAQSHPAFREIVEELARGAAVRAGGSAGPDRIEGAGHAVYYAPDVIGAYIRRQTG